MILGVVIYCKHTHILYSVLLPLIQTFQLLYCSGTRSILLSLVQTFHLLFCCSTRYILLSLAQIYKLLYCCKHKFYTPVTGTDFSSSFLLQHKIILLSLAQICKLLCCCSTSSILLLLVQTFQLLFVTAQELYYCHWHRHFIFFPFAAGDLYSCNWHRPFHLFCYSTRSINKQLKFLQS